MTTPKPSGDAQAQFDADNFSLHINALKLAALRFREARRALTDATKLLRARRAAVKRLQRQLRDSALDMDTQDHAAVVDLLLGPAAQRLAAAQEAVASSSVEEAKLKQELSTAEWRFAERTQRCLAAAQRMSDSVTHPTPAEEDVQ